MLIVALLSACASGPARPAGDPHQTVRRFLTALEANEIDAAYALLHPAVRKTLSRERFGELSQDNREEVLALIEELRAVEVDARARARVTTGHGEQVSVVLEDGTYKIAAGVLDAYALATPLDAVSELRRALLRGDLTMLLRVLSSERRAGYRAALGDTLERTEDPLDLRVERHGDTAVVHLTGGGELHLRREGGRWHVHDIK